MKDGAIKDDIIGVIIAVTTGETTVIAGAHEPIIVPIMSGAVTGFIAIHTALHIFPTVALYADSFAGQELDNSKFRRESTLSSRY